MAKKTKSKKVKKYPQRSKDVPATQEMLYEVRDGMLARFSSHDAKFVSIDARFEQVFAKFDEIDARFDEVDARFDSLEKKMDSKFHELKLLIEEQNARNAIVLDGLTSLFARQERIERRINQD